MQIMFEFMFVFFISIFLTGMIRRYVLSKNMLDVPNDRSSHIVPTPRGGGLAIVLVFTMVSLLLGLQQKISSSLFYALSGGIVIAVIGWLDDVISILPRQRAAVHLVMAIWATYWVGGLFYANIGLFAYPLAVTSIVWCVNLYNFMDGIDGLAGVEGLFISLGAAIALGLLGTAGISALCFMLAAAIAGFLVWNWPPAKIFMGDVGSGYLGYVFSILAIATANLKLLPVGFWLMLAAVFIADATITVLYRMVCGERWHEAHREHAYQQLIRQGASHRAVTVGILWVNVLILIPAAYTVIYFPQFGFWVSSLVLLSFWGGWRMIKGREPLIKMPTNSNQLSD